MPQPKRAKRAIAVRAGARPQVVADPRLGNGNPRRPSPPIATAPVASPSLETARRIAESVIVAAISSAGLYLVGTV
jgi:hypothetical protein